VELGRGSDDDVAARTQRFVRTLPQVEAALPARRWNRPTCATPTAMPCACGRHHHPVPPARAGTPARTARQPDKDT
jgi:hypothetical protein